MTLAQRLMAHPRCPGWQPGMIAVRRDLPLRYRLAAQLGTCWVGQVLGGSWPVGRLFLSGADHIVNGVPEGRIEDCDPDLTDPATAGVVLGWLKAERHNLTDTVAAQFIRNVRDVGLCLGEAAALALLALWGEP